MLSKAKHKATMEISFLVGRIWHKLALYLLCTSLICGLVSCQDSAEASVDGQADSESDSTRTRSTFVGHDPDQARKLVCDHTQIALSREISKEPETFEQWDSQIQSPEDFEYFFADKPFTPHPTSVCLGNTTCCKPPAEKQMLKVTSVEYKKDYQSVLQEEYFSVCPNVGRKFFHAMYETFKEIQRQLEIEVGQELEGELEEGFFDELFDYLETFLFHPDLCPLEGHLQSHMEKLVEFVYLSQTNKTINETSDPELQMCYNNVSNTFVTSYLKDVQDPLELQLSDLKLFVASVNMAEHMTNIVNTHSFSPNCISALMRLKYCAYCGGYAEFRPCLFFCLNTLRGCLADLTELHADYGSFVAALRIFSDSLIPQLEPQAFISGSLRHFVTLARDLRNTDLDYLVSSECDAPDRVKETRSIHERRNTFQSTLNPQSETTVIEFTDISYDVLSDVVLVELSCMDQLTTLLISVPDEMCYLSKDYIAHTGNVQCWTGASLGSYEEPLVGRSLAEQHQNPVFTEPLEMDFRYQQELRDLVNLTSELNKTIGQYACLSGDGDDCMRKVSYSCEDPGTPTEQPDDYISGSGLSSGAYPGDGSDLVDLEDPNEPDESEEDDVDANRPSSDKFDEHWPNANPDDAPISDMDNNFTGHTLNDEPDDDDDVPTAMDILDQDGNPVNRSGSGGGSGNSNTAHPTVTIEPSPTVGITFVNVTEDIPNATESPILINVLSVSGSVSTNKVSLSVLYMTLAIFYLF